MFVVLSKGRKEVLVPLRKFSSNSSKRERSLPGRLYLPGWRFMTILS